MIKKGILTVLIFISFLSITTLANATSYHQYNCSSQYCKINKKFMLSLEGGAFGVRISCANSLYAYLDIVDYEHSLNTLCSLTNKTLKSLMVSCFVANIGSRHWFKLNAITCRKHSEKK